jgi:hypothetical protein
MPYTPLATCNPNEPGSYNGDSMEKLCKALRAPYTPINKLKMRYHNPDSATGGGDQTIALKSGVQEGLWHKEYFGGNMPYPRLWDTGRSIQKSTSSDQDASDNLGQYTAIVGVGREGVPGNSAKPDQRCMISGWGEDTSFGGTQIKIPDPVTSWTELKLYQANTARNHNMICLARYDKAFKPDSIESRMMLVNGADPEFRVCTRCDRTSTGKLEKCTYSYKLADIENCYTEDPKKFAALQSKVEPVTNIWRGYFSDPVTADQFPNFPGGSSAGIKTGLDNAQCGDLILMPNGGNEAGDDRKGLPKLARVTAVNLPNRASCDSDKPTNCESQKNCYVQVDETDNGKWPDVCGTTNMVGSLKDRTLYKPGHYPERYQDEIDRADWKNGCEDTMLQHCVMKPWDSLKIYRMADDKRNLSSGGTP